MTEQVQPQPVRTFEFGPDAYGEDFKIEREYLGIVYSLTVGPGPSCIYDEGTKTYTVTSGDVRGEHVDGEYIVYELDLRDLDIPISQLHESGALAAIIEERKAKINVIRLQLGQEYKVPPGVLHQAVGKGILRIEVDKGFFPDNPNKVLEADKVDLSSFVVSDT